MKFLIVKAQQERGYGTHSHNRIANHETNRSAIQGRSSIRVTGARQCVPRQT